LLAVVIIVLIIGLAGLGLFALSKSAVPTATYNCQPKPCASIQGVTLSVSNIDRDFKPAQYPTGSVGGLAGLTPPSPRPSYHFVRVEVTFRVTQGSHELDPLVLNLKDPLGYQQPADLFIDPAGKGCDTTQGGLYGQGSTLGPTPVCFEVAGPINGALTLIWIPSGLTGPQPGAEIKLP
jgi:hypothetical protein